MFWQGKNGQKRAVPGIHTFPSSLCCLGLPLCSLSKQEKWWDIRKSAQIKNKSSNKMNDQIWSIPTVDGMQWNLVNHGINYQTQRSPDFWTPLYNSIYHDLSSYLEYLWVLGAQNGWTTDNHCQLPEHVFPFPFPSWIAIKTTNFKTIPNHSLMTKQTWIIPLIQTFLASRINIFNFFSEI